MNNIDFYSRNKDKTTVYHFKCNHKELSCEYVFENKDTAINLIHEHLRGSYDRATQTEDGYEYWNDNAIEYWNNDKIIATLKPMTMIGGFQK